MAGLQTNQSLNTWMYLVCNQCIQPGKGFYFITCIEVPLKAVNSKKNRTLSAAYK